MSDGKYVTFQFEEYKAFFDRLQKAAGGDFKKELELFLNGIGVEFLRIVEDEIIRRKVMDTRLLLNSFHQGGEDNLWELNEGGMSLTVGTNLTYAAYVNDGHWTNPKGVSVRFVPGRWEGSRFIYEPGAKTGMLLRQKWVEGSHYWESAVRIMEKMLPELMEAKIQDWLESYFSEVL